MAVEILGCIDRNLIEVRLSYAPGTVCVACASRKREAFWYALDRDFHRFAAVDVRQARGQVKLNCLVFEAGYVSDCYVGCVGNRVDANAEVLRDNRCFTIAGFGRGGFERQVDLAVEILRCIDRNLIEIRLSDAPGPVGIACASRKREAFWYALDRDLHRFAAVDVSKACTEVERDSLIFEAGCIGCGQVRCVRDGSHVDFNRCSRCQSASIGHCIAKLGWARVVRVRLEFDLAVIQQLHGTVFCPRDAYDTERIAVKVGVVAKQLIGVQIQRSIFGHGERVVHGRVGFIDVVDFDLNVTCPRLGSIGASDLEVDLGCLFEV